MIPRGPGLTFKITSGRLATGLELDPVTGIVRGEASEDGNFSCSVTASNRMGLTQAQLKIKVGSWNHYGHLPNRSFLNLSTFLESPRHRLNRLRPPPSTPIPPLKSWQVLEKDRSSAFPTASSTCESFEKQNIEPCLVHLVNLSTETFLVRVKIL